MQSRSMNLILSIFSLLLFASADIATADSTPRCAEDGKVFSIHAGEVVYGSITPTSDPANFFGGERTMKVIVEPPSPSLVFPSGWGYLFSTSAEVESSDMEMQSLTLQALFNGEVACEAGLTYNVLRSPASSSHHSDGKPSASSSEQAQSSSTNGAASLPRCSTQSTRRVYRPTEMYVGTFPLDLVESSCTYQARLLDQPSVGSAAVLLSDPMSYVYTSADEDWGKTTALAYEVACSTAAVCRGEVEIYIYESISTCPTSPMAYEVKLGTELGGSWEVGSTCPADSVASTTVQVLNGPGSLTLLSNEAFIFEATTTESDTIAVIRTSCDGQTLCDLTVAFISTANPHPPQPTTTTTTTEAPAPPIPTCSEEYLYQAPLGKTLRGSLDASLSSCELVTYGSPYMDGRFRGTLAVNILGDFIYTPPREQCVEVAYVNVSCLTTFVCQAKLIFAAYEDLSNDTVPSSSSDVGPTREPVPTCANVYYYQTAPSAPLSSSLNGMPGENACAYGRYFKLRSPPQAGSLEMTMSGDFLYTPRAHEGNYDFGFAMYCLNELACEGSAYLLVSNRWTLTPSEDSTSTKPVVITNPAITCSGTCNTKAWLTYPRPPMWDTTPGRGYGRKDGRPVDAIEVSWANQSLILTAMGMIGNLGARFPTFEPLTSKTGTYFEASDYDTSIAATSPAFNLSCLANQGRVGMGEDVWTWSELGYGTGTGSVGPMYNREVSWYQKFGGKHVQCDVFADPCQYAPLLNPSASAAYGGWTVDVDDCDVTWKGVFPFTHLTDIRRGDGSAVWSFVAHHTLRGTLLSEGVRPHSWISPGRFDTDYRTQEIVVGLKDYAMAFITGPGTPLLSVDAELFTYTTEAGDAAFGINLLCYPKVSLSMTSSYAPDRHVVGFKWTEQVWKAPGPNVCPRCTGKQMTCQASGQPALSTFHGDFPTGNCPDGVGRVELRKGPSMRQGECPAVEAVHEFGEVGISPTRGCKATYQNLTLRGVVPGSGSLSTAQRRAFHWDGHIILQLLMADGSRADVKVEMGLYVASLAASISVGQGELTACRSGSYWPVLDPLGSSTPARPFELSVQAPTSLCVDALSSSFGPNDWAFFTVQLPSVAASRVSLTHIFLDLDDAEQTRIVLFYKDPKTNTAALPPPELGQWWQHTQPYLSFRDLTGEALNRSLIGVSTSIPSGAVAAFLMIPGAINVRTDVEVVVGVEIDAGTTKASRATYRKKLHVAPLLTERSRQGPPQGAANLVVAQRSDLYAIGAAAAVSVALIVAAVMFMVADNKRPLPSWLPRGKVIKHGVLSLVPTALRPKKKSNEAAPLPVHTSMYEAMNSGHF